MKDKMQRTNKPYQSKSSYYLLKALKLAVFAFVILTAFSSQVQSQQYLACQGDDGLTISPFDSVKIIKSTGKPKDTVWVPVFLTNDSSMSGFSMLIHWDSTKIKPYTILDIADPLDPNDDVDILVTQLAGRFVKTIQVGAVIDTITNFFAQFSLNPFDSGAIIAAYNLGLPPGDTVLTTVPGSGVIFRMAFILDSSMQHNDSALIRFYEVQPVFFDTSSGTPITLDCRRTEMSADHNNTGIPITIYPKTIDGYIVADTAPGPQIVDFSADPDTITPGSFIKIRYDVNNADSLKIIGPGVTIFDSTDFVGLVSVLLSSTSSFLLTAWNAFGTADSFITVTVVADTGDTGGPDVNAPNISFPQGSFHVIEQGQTVTFDVTASDPNAGDIVELSANNVPANAVFNTVVGTNTVTGSFSFTPDFNQEGTFVVQFVAIDNGGASSAANASITVEALEFDRLFSSSAPGQNPIGGLTGTTRDMVFPINMVTSQTVYGIQFDMLYDHRAIKIDSLIGTPRIQNFAIYENLGDVPGEVKVLAFGLANDSVVADTTSSAIMNAYLTIDTGAIPWTDYVIDLLNGRESVNPDPQIPSIEMITEGGVVRVDKRGDVNLDQRIDVADLVSIVAYIIGNFGLPPRQFETADLIINDTVNVFDLVGTINTIFGIPVSPTPTASTEPATMSLSYQDLNPGGRDVMVVRSYLPEKIAAVELDIEFDPTVVVLGAPKLAADASEMTMQYKISGEGKMKILMHFTNPFDAAQQLPAGNIDMLEIPMYAQRYVNTGDETQLKINGALLSTSTSASIAVDGISGGPLLPETFELFQNYPNPFNPTTTIEFTIGLSSDGSATQDVALDIFNILGQRVNTLVDEKLPSGHYSIEWNSRSISGHRVATGIYFYRLIVGSESETKKMLLIK